MGIATYAHAALYNIVNTDFFVNGMPASLTVKEKAKLVTTTIAKTDAAIKAGKYKPLATDQARNTIREIIKAETPPATLMPFVDISKEIKPALGYNSLRLRDTSEVALSRPAPSGGEFRIACDFSHMSNDDPIVFPNQQGAAHHHTFFGNTSLNFKSDLSNLNASGNSTCFGGNMNKSAYWIPSTINTETGEPLKPTSAMFYYKSGLVDAALIVAPPKGLRMIAGNMKAKDGLNYNNMGFSCLPGKNSTRKDWPWISNIPTGKYCEVGDDLIVMVSFPQCWDGKNLDSPNHQDHMAYPINLYDQIPRGNGHACPTSHPIAITHLTVNVHYAPTSNMNKWRLSSDNYLFDGANAGYSMHSDYVEGWDRALLEGFVKNCINARRDCHAHLTGDGRMMY